MKENKGDSRGRKSKKPKPPGTLMPVFPDQIPCQRPGSYKNAFEGGLRYLESL